MKKVKSILATALFIVVFSISAFAQNIIDDLES